MRLAIRLLSLWRLFAPVCLEALRAKGDRNMATVSQPHLAQRQLSDNEFEELLQRTWELIQAQKQQVLAHPFESAESPSWT